MQSILFTMCFYGMSIFLVLGCALLTVLIAGAVKRVALRRTRTRRLRKRPYVRFIRPIKG